MESAREAREYRLDKIRDFIREKIAEVADRENPPKEAEFELYTLLNCKDISVPYSTAYQWGLYHLLEEEFTGVERIRGGIRVNVQEFCDAELED